MNDNSVSAAVRSRLAEVRESLADVHMGVPVGDILDRARRRRARRRHGALAAAAGTCGSVALAAALILVPGGAARTSAKPAQLTAWTVTRQSNGEIKVTIRELKDPAGLQRKLRADGVPASVSFLSDQNPACRSFGNVKLTRKVFPRPEIPQRIHWHVVILIRPSALPHGAGVEIAASVSYVHLHLRNRHRLALVTTAEFGVVYASRGCTGS